jgi:hypothetical protein
MKPCVSTFLSPEGIQSWHQEPPEAALKSRDRRIETGDQGPDYFSDVSLSCQLLLLSIRVNVL